MSRKPGVIARATFGILLSLAAGCGPDRPPRDEQLSSDAAQLFEACMASEGAPVEDVRFDIDVRGRWHGSQWRPKNPGQRGNSPEVTAADDRCSGAVRDRFPS